MPNGGQASKYHVDRLCGSVACSLEQLGDSGEHLVVASGLDRVWGLAVNQVVIDRKSTVLVSSLTDASVSVRPCVMMTKPKAAPAAGSSESWPTNCPLGVNSVIALYWLAASFVVLTASSFVYRAGGSASASAAAAQPLAATAMNWSLPYGKPLSK
jgi:hypothetical protein